MDEKILDTLRAILQTELPINSDGYPAIYDRAIVGWYYGARKTYSSVPAVIFEAKSVPPTDVGYALQQIEHRITITYINSEDNPALTDRIHLEEARLIYNILRRHRIIYIIDLCPFDDVFMLSPQHFLDAHGDIIQPYIDSIIVEKNTDWAITSDENPPTWDQIGLIAQAFMEFYKDVLAGNIPAGITSDIVDKIQQYGVQQITPIRLLYDVKITEPELNSNIGNAFQREGVMNLTASELMFVPEFGPNNVSTDTWQGSDILF